MFQDDGSQKAEGDVADTVPEVQETVQVIPGSKLLWRVNTRPPNSAQVRTPPLQVRAFLCPQPLARPLSCSLGLYARCLRPLSWSLVAVCPPVGPCCRVSLWGPLAIPEPLPRPGPQ